MPNTRQAPLAQIAEEARRSGPHRRSLAEQAGNQHAVYQGHARSHLVSRLEQDTSLLELTLRRGRHRQMRETGIGDEGLDPRGYARQQLENAQADPRLSRAAGRWLPTTTTQLKKLSVCAS